ncbi:MAG: hypothetical protein LBG13_00980 [Holosporales bacterium]|jgi:hypothetical protein|nr:hypothetical protein [Holosporales bacterium]
MKLLVEISRERRLLGGARPTANKQFRREAAPGHTGELFLTRSFLEKKNFMKVKGS